MPGVLQAAATAARCVWQAMGAIMIDPRRMHRLCFRALSETGCGFAFPCDRTGRVDLDGLTERVRNDYLYARAMVGRELSEPIVEECLCEPDPGL